MCHLMPSWPVFLRQAVAAFVCKWLDDQWLIVVCDALAARSAISPPRGRHAERPTTGRGEDYCLCVLQARCRPHERRFCLGARLELALDAPPWLAACLSPPRHLLFVSNGNHTNSQGEDNGGIAARFIAKPSPPRWHDLGNNAPPLFVCPIAACICRRFSPNQQWLCNRAAWGEGSCGCSRPFHCSTVMRRPTNCRNSFCSLDPSLPALAVCISARLRGR